MVGLTGTRSNTVVVDVDSNTQEQQIRAHEGGVFVEQSTNAQEEQTLTTGAQHGYTHSDVVVQKDSDGNLSNEKSEWQNRNKLTATDKGKLTYEGSLRSRNGCGPNQCRWHFSFRFRH